MCSGDVRSGRDKQGHGKIGKIVKVVEFVLQNRVEVPVVESGVGVYGIRAGNEIEIVFGVVDRVVWAPLDDETALLNKGLILVEGEGLNTRDGGIGHRNRKPVMTGDLGAGGEGHEVEIALGISGGVE